jgi:hypothetical protein
MGEAVATAADAAEDLLLVYYVGHGLVSTNGSLHLATARTDRRSTRVEHTALAYNTVRRYLLDCAARSIVVVLDCCFSGRALDALGESDEQIAALAAIDGGFVLTSAGREEMALAPPGRRHTAFTGEWLRLLEYGDPDGPTNITLNYSYRYLAAKLPAAGYPRPQYQSKGMTGDLVLAPNTAYRRRAGASVAAVSRPSIPSPSPALTVRSAPELTSSTAGEPVLRRGSSRISPKVMAGTGVLVGLVVVGALAIPKLISDNSNGKPETDTTTSDVPCRVTVTVDGMNVRSSPSLDPETVVDKLNLGEELYAEKIVQNGYRKLAEDRWASLDLLQTVSGYDCG